MNEPLKILAIGNSFSQDATRYLEAAGEAGGRPVLARNLYIPGCSLERHAENLRHRAYEYEYQKDGEHLFSTILPDRKKGVSIRMALAMEEWDIVTVQQVSHLAGVYESYFPWLSEILSVVRAERPRAAIWFHGTWAYEPDCRREQFAQYRYDAAEMTKAVLLTTERVAGQFGLPVIPVGALVAALREKPAFDPAQGGVSLCRDGFHLSFDYGRYAAALVWYRALAGGSVKGLPFSPEGAEPSLVDLIQETVEQVVGRAVGAAAV
ncbi:MAG: DUF4886 domain-containing protein [Oscillospiraceae bacterium]|jgi:hypothetical protein|nr:DUF4886 domain-containing protein [Oscillospiraceae bacterium]